MGARKAPVEELGYRELQAELKALGINAKGSYDVLRERLLDARGGPQPGKTAPAAVQPQQLADSTELQTTSPRATTGRAAKSEPVTTRKKAKEAEDSTIEDLSEQRYTVTTYTRGQKNAPNAASVADSLLSASKTAFPAEAVAVSVQKQETTPLQKAKQAAKKAVHAAQRRIPAGSWKWLLPALLSTLLGLLILTQWKHTRYWQSRMSSQLDDLQQSVQEAYDYSKQSAQRAYEYSQQGALQLGQQARNGYVGIQDAAGNLGSRVYHGGGYLYDSSAQLAAGGWERAQAWIPGSNKLRALLPTAACSARLNATKLEPIFPREAAWEGVITSLHDVWAGVKDEPLKGVGVLLAGSSREALRTAGMAVKAAVPSDCQHCFLHLQGESLAEAGADAAGDLQSKLASLLTSCPYAIVHVEAVNKLHADVVPVFISAMSEQGALTSKGKEVPAYKALYIGSTLAPSELFDKDEEGFAAAVKKDLVFQLGTTTDLSTEFIPDAFRRRWDIVAPLRKTHFFE